MKFPSNRFFHHFRWKVEVSVKFPSNKLTRYRWMFILYYLLLHVVKINKLLAIIKKLNISWFADYKKNKLNIIFFNFLIARGMTIIF